LERESAIDLLRLAAVPLEIRKGVPVEGGAEAFTAAKLGPS
jgi:hypothetical protein